MDLDDLLVELFGEADLGPTRSRRATLLARMLFGLIGTGLGLVGAFVMLTRPAVPGAPALRVAMALTLVGLAAFSACNVMLGRAWRWPWLLFAGAFVAMFALRLAGA